MLAKFENGYFLEVNVCDGEYEFFVYDEDDSIINSGYTEYRNIAMYYPMNEIDYILEYCDPGDVEGKYEIIDSSMEIDEDYDLEYGDGGDWMLERQGEEDDVRSYSTFEKAQAAMKKEYEELLEERRHCMDNELNESDAYIGDEEFYQSWKIYKESKFDNKIDEKFYEIQKELDRADIGVTQYSFELMDTGVIRSHLYEIEKLLKELKEMI